MAKCVFRERKETIEFASPIPKTSANRLFFVVIVSQLAEEIYSFARRVWREALERREALYPLVAGYFYGRLKSLGLYLCARVSDENHNLSVCHVQHSRSHGTAAPRAASVIQFPGV